MTRPVGYGPYPAGPYPPPPRPVSPGGHPLADFGSRLLAWLIEAAFVVFAFVLQYVYEVEMMYRSGRTVGKRVMKLRVIPIDPSRRMTRGTAATRYLIQFVVGGIVPFFSFIDGLWPLWDTGPYLQTLHDKVAQTVVIKLSA